LAVLASERRRFVFHPISGRLSLTNITAAPTILNDIHSRHRVRIEASPNTKELQIIATKEVAEDIAQEIEDVLSAVIEEPLDLSVFSHWVERWGCVDTERLDLRNIKQAVGSSRVAVTGLTGSTRFGKVSDGRKTKVNLLTLAALAPWHH
jgi:hypothetical protein